MAPPTCLREFGCDLASLGLTTKLTLRTSYAAFGNGPRKCLGERLAHNEGRLVMAGLLRKYRIVGAEGWKLDIDQRAMLIPDGVKVKLIPL